MTPKEEQIHKFVKLCGDGDLQSVMQLLDQDPSLIKARGEWTCKL